MKTNKRKGTDAEGRGFYLTSESLSLKGTVGEEGDFHWTSAGLILLLVFHVVSHLINDFDLEPFLFIFVLYVFLFATMSFLRPWLNLTSLQDKILLFLFCFVAGHILDGSEILVSRQKK
jgi:hypothetical protein